MSMEFDGSIPISSDRNSVSDFAPAFAADKIDALAAAVGEAFGIVETDVFLRSDIETEREKVAVCGAENSEEYSVETIKNNAPNSENISCGNSEIYSDNLKISSNEITENNAANPTNYSAEILNNGAANLQGSDREISERTAAVSMETNAANFTDYSAETIEYSTINSALNEKISNSGSADSPIKMLSAFGGLEEINIAAERLRVLSSPSGYVFANALTNADTERNFNIHLNVGGVNLGDRAVRTNGAAVNIDWHDAMMNNGGGQ